MRFQNGRQRLTSLNTLLVALVLSACAGAQRSAQEPGSSPPAETGNPVLDEIQRILDLQSNPDAEISGQNSLAADGTGTMVIDVKTTKLLRLKPRAAVVAGLGSQASSGNIEAYGVKVRVEITRPENRLTAKASLDVPVLDQTAFQQFLATSPSVLAAYRGALEMASLGQGSADGAPRNEVGPVDVTLTFDASGSIHVVRAAARGGISNVPEPAPSH